MSKFIVFSTKLLAATLVAAFFTSCHYKIDLGNGTDGNGNITRETRNVGSNFTKIEVSSGLSVSLEQADNYLVEVEADENLQNLISVQVENGTLVITTNENIDEAAAKNVIVKLPELTGIEATSGTYVTTVGSFSGTNIDIRTSSGSNTELALEFENINCEATSGSSLQLRGKALQLRTASSSGSTIDAGGLLANDITSESSSGSSTGVHPAVSLNAKASSGSSINYAGTPHKVSKEETSGGSVTKE